jgi:hypothetical protein
VLSVALAHDLQRAGLRWDEPEPGDRFVVNLPEMLTEPFVLSDVVADMHDVGGSRVIGFNGTVEWALDSVRLEDTLWLPREDQLRQRVDPWLRRLERDDGCYRVVLDIGGEPVEVEGATAEEAYAHALLRLLEPGA